MRSGSCSEHNSAAGFHRSAVPLTSYCEGEFRSQSCLLSLLISRDASLIQAMSGQEVL